MLPPVTYSIQRLPQTALEKIPMCDVRGIDLDALPLQDSQLEVQQLGRYMYVRDGRGFFRGAAK